MIFTLVTVAATGQAVAAVEATFRAGVAAEDVAVEATFQVDVVAEDAAVVVANRITHISQCISHQYKDLDQ